MSASDIDDFAANIFEGSLQLVNQLPDTVYRFGESFNIWKLLIKLDAVY